MEYSRKFFAATFLVVVFSVPMIVSAASFMGLGAMEPSLGNNYYSVPTGISSAGDIIVGTRSLSDLPLIIG